MTRHALTLVTGADGFPVDPMDGVRRHEETLAAHVGTFIVSRGTVIDLESFRRAMPGSITLVCIDPMPQALASLARPFSLKVCP